MSGERNSKLDTFSLAAQLAEAQKNTDEHVKKLELRIKELEGNHRNEDSRESASGKTALPDGPTAQSHERSGVLQSKNEVVILVHGIRDRALWQSEIRAALRSEGFDVALTNYERFDLLRFLIPIPVFRNAVLRSIRDQIRSVRLQNPNKDMSVIAHSFGTYVMSRVMNEEFDINFKRIIFCGGVYSNKIKFEQFSNRFLPPILNEIGTKDYFPALANSITWGYGSPGTFGFRRPLFEDRWHKDAGHSYFLSKEFCARYWVPFLSTGNINGGEESPDQPHWMIRLIETVHIKYTVICLLLLGVLAYRFL